jgi:hypothetical protein
MEGPEPCLCLPDVRTNAKISLEQKGIRKQVGYITFTQNSPQTHENAEGPPGETRSSDDKEPPGGMPRKNRERVSRTAPRCKNFLRPSCLEPHLLISTRP